jgi:hypothetical protein
MKKIIVEVKEELGMYDERDEEIVVCNDCGGRVGWSMNEINVCEKCVERREREEWNVYLRRSKVNKDVIYGFEEDGRMVEVGRVKKGVDVVKLWNNEMKKV